MHSIYEKKNGKLHTTRNFFNQPHELEFPMKLWVINGFNSAMLSFCTHKSQMVLFPEKKKTAATAAATTTIMFCHSLALFRFSRNRSRQLVCEYGTFFRSTFEWKNDSYTHFNLFWPHDVRDLFNPKSKYMRIHELIVTYGAFFFQLAFCLKCRM